MARWISKTWMSAHTINRFQPCIAGAYPPVGFKLITKRRMSMGTILDRPRVTGLTEEERLAGETLYRA